MMTTDMMIIDDAKKRSKKNDSNMRSNRIESEARSNMESRFKIRPYQKWCSTQEFNNEGRGRRRLSANFKETRSTPYSLKVI